MAFCSATDAQPPVPLTGVIAARSTYVVAANASDFELVYGFPPSEGFGLNSPADSNGDDDVELGFGSNNQDVS